jgi:hypothetical protein
MGILLYAAKNALRAKTEHQKHRYLRAAMDRLAARGWDRQDKIQYEINYAVESTGQSVKVPDQLKLSLYYYVVAYDPATKIIKSFELSL